MNVASPSEAMLVALQLVAENGPIRPREFAELMWPHRAGWRRVSNCGHGATRGSGMHLAGGAYLGKLRRRGLVEPEFGAPRFLRGYVLTALGRRVLEAHGAALERVTYGAQVAPGEVVTWPAFGAWRYCYHGQDDVPGVFCNPVRYDDDQRCVIRDGRPLVVFAGGVVRAVERRALRLRARCGEHGRKESVGESTEPSEAWVTLYATPRHRSVVCGRCRTTPGQRPGPGWRRCGTDPQSWQHLCPACAAKGA